MQKKKDALGAGIAKAGKGATTLLDKAKRAVVNAVDQNDDGKLGLDDLSAIKDSVKSAVKDNSEKWAEKQELQKKEKELKELRPFFADDVENPNFSLPKLIRVAEMDSKHAESSLCENSIGYIFSDKEMDIMTIYPDKIEQFDLKFYPELDCGLYYVDPNDRDFYISMEEYFTYLKIARVSELQRIAQALGATHFKVVYKEHKKSFAGKDCKVGLGAKLPGKQGGNASSEHQSREEEFSNMEIAAEMIFLGHVPVKPELKYFRKDPQIQNLVDLRMSDNQIKHQTYTLDLGNSSGIKIKDAMKIDAALKTMKVDGNASITSEAENESRRIFVYEIDF